MTFTPRFRRRRPARAPGHHAPLSRLRRRFAVGAWAAAVVFVTVFVADLLRGSPGINVAAVGVEVCAAAVGVACFLVAMLTWIITEHVAYLASLWNLIENMRSVGAPGSGLRVVGAEGQQPASAGVQKPPIPIQRGHEMRQQRRGRHAV